MDTFDILREFGEYINYDPNQTSFNLLSSDYKYYKAGKHITTICDVYDPTGRMAVLYARHIYDSVIVGARVKLQDILVNQDLFYQELKMYNIFHSETVKQIEDDYISALNHAALIMTGKEVIGERNLENEKEIMYNSIESVVEQLGSCHEDVYVVSYQPIGKIDNISTKIHLFNYMAECVLTIQNNAPDGVYFCYINNNGTSDGYFAIMIKSNGNLFSINDRISESYIGQHTNSRNGRWSEDHSGIFPYDQVMTFSDHDYLGYAHTYSIDESKLNLKDMDAKYYIPVLLAIICIINGRTGKILDDKKVVYLNSLIQDNLLEQGESKSLIELDKTGLIASTTKLLDIKFDRDKFLSGGYIEEFTPNRGIKNQKYVEMYSHGFELKNKTLTMNATNILESNRYRPNLTNEQGNKQIHAEFIGSIEKMRLQAYYESRIELANYIRDRMKEELEEFGGIGKVREWLSDSFKDNIKNLYPILARLYHDYSSLKECRCNKDYHKEDDPLWIKDIRILDETNPYIRYSGHYNEVKYRKNRWGENLCPEYYLCPITGNRATIWFEFRIVDESSIREFIGNKELIRPLQNWHSNNYHHNLDEFFYEGNPILDATDAVDFIKPLDGSDVNFNYYIGFSKRGMNRLIKECYRNK